jgi:predicted transcriptional regulator
VQKPKTQLTPLELHIMKTLWESGPGNVQAVQEKLPGERLAYTTVQTMLNILQRKGKVKRRLVGKAYEYRAVLSREKAVRESTPKAAAVKANYGGEGVNAASDGAFAKITADESYVYLLPNYSS